MKKNIILFAICAMSSNLVMADKILQISGDFGGTRSVEASEINGFCTKYPGLYADCRDWPSTRDKGNCKPDATQYCYICGGKDSSQWNKMQNEKRFKSNCSGCNCEVS